MEIIKIENLSFSYPDEDKKAIRNISLSIEEGEFITLCGKSGCGKSTLLRQLKPILSPHGERSGTIYYKDRDIKELSEREQAENIGFVFQNPDSQIVTDKVWHELAFGLESLSFTKTEIRTRVSEMASYFGMGDWFYKNVTELSGGQKHLLNLASVMVMQPKLLILDEPTSQLDPIAAEDFLQTVHKINRELGVTVILSEHRLEIAFPLSDRVIVMEDGEIIANGTPKRVGEILSKSGNDMFDALPTPIKLYYASEKDAECPVTVRDARVWLKKIPVNKDMDFSDRQTVKGNTALKISDVWFRYEKDSSDVLKGLSLTVDEGELYAVVGGNGSGKTTMLSVIAGVRRHYRGSVTVANKKKISMLPQNPQSLFVKKTIRLDLYEMLAGTGLSNEERDRELTRVIELCELSQLLDSHPYDLSGGEMQRAALAKVLITRPDILLLDEPTKGLDAHFKIKLAKMLYALKQIGVTIVMVSHDIEFCAKYADRCAMFFDGIVVSEGTPRKFFSDNNFYTTTANKIARDIIDGAVLDEDIIQAVGGKQQKKNDNEIKLSVDKTERKAKTPNVCAKKDKGKIDKRMVMSAITILLLIPVTILAGVYCLGDRKYYFISLLIILEIMLPFALIFEGRRPQAREIVILSVLSAIGVAGRCAFYAIPQFKPVAAIVIIAGVCFGGEAGFLVGAVTAFVSNFFFGQGPFTPWQMFGFGCVGFSAGALFEKGILRKRKTELSVFGFLATLVIYGGIVNPASVILAQPNPTIGMFITAYAMGFPFDLIHALSTAFLLYFITEPMIDKLDRIKIKYGL